MVNIANIMEILL